MRRQQPMLPEQPPVKELEVAASPGVNRNRLTVVLGQLGPELDPLGVHYERPAPAEGGAGVR